MSEHDVSIIQIVREGIALGHSYSEIGASLGMTRSAVAGIVYRRLKGQGVRASETGRRRPAPAPKREPRPRARSIPKPPREPKAPREKRKPSTTAFAFRVVETVSSRAIKSVPDEKPFWDEELDDRLRVLVTRMPTILDIATAMGRPVGQIATRMVSLNVVLKKRLAESERDAIDRLYDEGVSIRRIAIRVGVALNLVEKRVADIEAGLAVMVCRGAQKSATRKAPLVSELKRRAG